MNQPVVDLLVCDLAQEEFADYLLWLEAARAKAALPPRARSVGPVIRMPESVSLEA